ncbi:MAG TPA: hypothetical protein VIK83_05270 [Coriobacteriia bacterium]
MNPLLLGILIGIFPGFVFGGVVMAVLAAAARETPKPSSYVPRHSK